MNQLHHYSVTTFSSASSRWLRPARRKIGNIMSPDDRVFKLITAPVLGLSIPFLSGLFLPGCPGVVIALSEVFFVLVSWLIWTGAVKIIVALRKRLLLNRNVYAKLAVLSVGAALYDAVIVFIFCFSWQLVFLHEIHAKPLYSSIAYSMAAVVVLTLIYESLYLSAEKETAYRCVSEVEEKLAWSQIHLLRNELEPHFYLNCLNVLSYLIRTDQAKANTFVVKLGRVFNYLLVNKEKAFVPIEEELSFLRNYCFLLEVRYDSAIRFTVVVPEKGIHDLAVLPCALQLLVENAVKHNRIDPAEPLPITVTVAGSSVVVSNPRRPKPATKTTGIGLENLRKRYLLLHKEEIVTNVSEREFSVVVPLLPLSAQ